MSTLKKSALILLTIFLLPTTVKAANLSVPFTPQAPYGDWSQPWQDACEETSILMVDAFYGERSLNQRVAAEEILKILRIKERTYGPSLDEDAQKVVDIINAFFPWEAYIAQNPSLEDIKNEIDAGRPVILPVYGKGLFNPHFVDGGPYYHMNVVSGYDDESEMFIIQEPGTHAGLDFRYPYDRIISAMHDYLPSNRTMYGRKVAIFTRPRATDQSFETDGDGDGLSKADELRFGSILWLSDSDGDGLTDGDEVKRGRLPTVPNDAPRDPFLIKSPTDPKVYLIKNGTKHHVASEAVFLGRGWGWNQITMLSESMLAEFQTGNPVE